MLSTPVLGHDPLSPYRVIYKPYGTRYITISISYSFHIKKDTIVFKRWFSSLHSRALARCPSFLPFLISCFFPCSPHSCIRFSRLLSFSSNCDFILFTSSLPLQNYMLFSPVFLLIFNFLRPFLPSLPFHFFFSLSSYIFYPSFIPTYFKLLKLFILGRPRTPAFTIYFFVASKGTKKNMKTSEPWQQHPPKNTLIMSPQVPQNLLLPAPHLQEEPL